MCNIIEFVGGPYDGYQYEPESKHDALLAIAVVPFNRQTVEAAGVGEKVDLGMKMSDSVYELLLIDNRHWRYCFRGFK